MVNNKVFFKFLLSFLVIIFLSVNTTSQDKRSSVTDSNKKVEKRNKKKKKKKIKLPNIDLSHWKVTLPVANAEGKPVEIDPPEIISFAKMDVAKPTM